MSRFPYADQKKGAIEVAEQAQEQAEASELVAMAGSDRKEITRGLSVLLEEYFSKNKIKWAREVEVRMPWSTEAARVDYMTYSYPKGWSGGMYQAEQGKIGIYEVKSCMADYKSGHGLGWYGDDNVLVCPSTLAKELRGYDLFRVRVLCPIMEGRSVQQEMKDPIPYSGEIEGWSLRSFIKANSAAPRSIPLAYALAQMIYANFAHGDAKGIRS